LKQFFFIMRNPLGETTYYRATFNGVHIFGKRVHAKLMDEQIAKCWLDFLMRDGLEVFLSPVVHDLKIEERKTA
jgi:hypothetical protein